MNAFDEAVARCREYGRPVKKGAPVALPAKTTETSAETVPAKPEKKAVKKDDKGAGK